MLTNQKWLPDFSFQLTWYKRKTRKKKRGNIEDVISVHSENASKIEVNYSHMESTIAANIDSTNYLDTQFLNKLE